MYFPKVRLVSSRNINQMPATTTNTNKLRLVCIPYINYLLCTSLEICMKYAPKCGRIDIFIAN